ncbi:class I SAM-dependent methyltransferase [uncultured Ilumatobacter sp.]|uniref:class I SAM-dependent methyltransferase n=1 Tax=uncultured Ilumatobacter sp. TaxID=879968 RepID=UPI00374EA42E
MRKGQTTSARLSAVVQSLIETERFAQRYAMSSEANLRVVELEALGSDYQATGYTTREQADGIGRLLALEPGKVLVDIGAGSGWPGLYLATTFGCSVISVDPTMEGCSAAFDRIESDGLVPRALALLGTGEKLPIRSGSIDAIVHADVMC